MAFENKTSQGATRAVAAAVTLLLVGCGAATPRFPLADIRWQDDDMHPFGPEPDEQYNSWLWDGADNSIVRHMSEVWLYETSHEAQNVNALDEVPDSSWFINRLGRYTLPDDVFRHGACTPDEPPRPWRVIEAKPGGTSPGMLIMDANGDRHIFKVDYRDQEERGTASDAISTRMFHAVGYATPCNRVVVFDREDIVLDMSVVDADDDDAPTAESIEEVLGQATPAPGGRLRGSLSAFIQGSLLGGWSFSGTRDTDLNDVIDHRDRRDVRGQYVMSAWLNHVDARDANNMDVWVETSEGQGYIQHYVLDAGDSFGIIWPASHAMSRRLGQSSYADVEHILGDLLTLGLLDRGWDESVAPPRHPVFGYYEVERFDPDGWRNGYSNPAYQRRTERDSAWMARIVSRFGLQQLRAVVEAGKFSRQEYSDHLVRVLEGRRQRLLERFLTRLSPMAWPHVETDRLCLEDLAVSSGLRSAETRVYSAATHPLNDTPPTPIEVDPRDDGVCVTLPDVTVASGEPSYLVVDLVAATTNRETTAPARVHLYQLGPARYQVVGLERPNG
ncbi:MAG: hypothetical protein AB8I08_40065 [Sandaracinaceae bacterium]